MADTSRARHQLNLSEPDPSASMRIPNYHRFLAEASRILASSLDYRTTLASVAKLVTPNIADWCAVDILLPSGKLERVAIAHVNPKKVELARELMVKFPTDMNATYGVAKVIREGTPEYWPEISDEMLQAGAKSEEHLKIMRGIGFRSAVVVPLQEGARTFGALTIVNSETDYSFTEADLQLTMELARRSACAIENARLYEVARKNSEYDQKHWLLLSALLENAPLGFAYLNQNLEYVLLNRSLAKMVEKTPEEFLGKRLGTIVPPWAQAIKPFLQKVLEKGEAALDQEMEVEISGSGKTKFLLTNFYPICSEDDEVVGVGVMVLEITNRKEMEESFRHQALHDTLTKLPNRPFFEESLLEAIRDAKEKNQVLGVMFLDLDRFKNINDTLGHTIGDAILKEVADRLRHSVRKDDLVARLGGDEFMILLRDVKNPDNVSRVAKKLQKSLAPIIKVDDYVLHTVASIGIAMYPDNGQDVENLIRYADAALHSAKASGRNRYEFYNRNLNDKISERMDLENDLREALVKNELRVHYEPIVDIRTGKILNLEALIRWQHPTRGLLAPGSFINIAEESGLIVPMGRWVLRRVCRDFRALQKSGKVMVPRIAVNLSAREFLEANLVRNIAEILRETEMDPANLELEITESIAMDDMFKTSEKLKELDQMGIRITIDDFGTGYSSLAYLKKFPIRKLKIDRSFVKDCTVNVQDAALVKAIVAMAQSLNLVVVAEGVENEEQLRYLTTLGCDAVQGKLIALARDTKDLNQWFKDRTSLFAQSYWNAD